MTPQDVINELARALRTVIVETDEAHLRANPSEAYIDLACRLIFQMKAITVVPVKTPEEARGAREDQIRKADYEALEYMFKTLDGWLRGRDPGIRTLETAANTVGRVEVTLSEVKTLGEQAGPEVRGFFQGESVRDAYGQAAQTIVFGDGEL